MGEESPQVCEKAYQEVRQWRAESFGWLEPKDFDPYLDKLQQVRGRAASSCAARRRKVAAGDYEPPEVAYGEPRFGPLRDFPRLFRAVVESSPTHAWQVIQAATPEERDRLDEEDLEPIMPQGSPLMPHASPLTKSAESVEAEQPPQGERTTYKSPIAGEKLARLTAAGVIEVVLDDAVWRAFGYNGRPRKGLLLRKIIRLLREAEIEREIFLTREICALAIVTLCLQSNVDAKRKKLGEMAARVIELLSGANHIQDALDFKTAGDCAWYLAHAVGEYLASDADSWPIMLFARAEEGTKALDVTEKSRWIAGIIHIASNYGLRLYGEQHEIEMVAPDVTARKNLTIAGFPYLEDRRLAETVVSYLE